MREFYYWLVSHDESGKPYLVFGCPAREGEETCRQRGIELLGGMDFEIKRLPTRDLGRASALLRGKRLERTHSLKTASARIGHDRSVKRLRRKRAAADVSFSWEG